MLCVLAVLHSVNPIQFNAKSHHSIMIRWKSYFFLILNSISAQRFIQARHSSMKSLSVSDLLISQQQAHSEIRHDSGVQQHFFEQRLDHFASHPCNDDSCHNVPPLTFQQRFFYSNRFVNPQKSFLRGRQKSPFPSTHTVAFLCIGGEGPYLDSSVLIDSVHCTGDMIELAEKLYKNHGMNVHLFALEHRYYGLSYPVFPEDNNDTSPVSNKHLLYLSSRQALSDLATFIIYINNHPDFFQSFSIPWITFGGSYPGMLSAWLRLKFPHLVLGSVSHSAPIQVKLDFYEYKEKVAWDLINPDIGGSYQCLERIQRGHYEIDQRIQSNTVANRTLVADMFSLCHGANSLTERANVLSFLGDGVVDIPVQENDPNCQGHVCNVNKICDFLISFQGQDDYPASIDEQALASLSNIQLHASSQTCKNIDWSEMISFISSPDAQMEGIRSWYWQTCTEMGFFQTCPFNSTCPFSRGLHNIQQDLDICRIAFGISSDLVQKNVDETRAYYGGWFLQGTNILSVNGDVDPWSTLTAKSQCHNMKDDEYCTSNTPIIWVPGASHHFWTHKSKPSDTTSIINVRELIHTWVLDLLLGPTVDRNVSFVSEY